MYLVHEAELLYSELLTVPGFATGPILMKGGNHMAEKNYATGNGLRGCGGLHKLRKCLPGRAAKDR